MKTLLALTFGLITSMAFAQSNVSPLRITHFDHAATLKWTNQMGANVPVYQILRTTTVTGNWQHFYFITNTHSTTLTNSVSTDAPAVFHKLLWLSDTPMVFSYEFDEGFGTGPCVNGQMTVSLLTNGTWDFDEDGFCLDGFHVTGTGTLRPRVFNWNGAPHTAQFDLTNPPDSQFLEATLQGSMAGGTLVYTGMVGTVYQNGFAGATPLGTFRSRRLQ